MLKRDSNSSRPIRRSATWLMVFTLMVAPLGVLAQGTKIVAPKNGYDIREDVQAGRQAATEVEQQLPVLRDSEVTDYVNRVGSRLVRAIPSEFNHSEFRYTFKVVNARDINAFALPGGPMYVNRGMIEAARNEGELAGVMAHEISHVALRHGTAQATKAQKYAIGAAAGQILGAIIGGGVGSVIAQGTQFGIGAYFLKFSREYETQADILGAQIMSRAGYDPRDLANMFRTIERESGSRGGPEWLSSHPNPGNRYERINQEARMLGRADTSPVNSRDFQQVKARLRGMQRAPSMEEIARAGGNRSPRGDQERRRPTSTNGRLESRVELPSSRMQTYTGGNLFQISVPENWRELESGNAVTFSPEGAYSTLDNGQFVFTHGVQAGVARTQGRDLQQSTNEFINALLESNPYLNSQGRYQRADINRRDALAVRLVGRSELTGRNEAVTVITTQLRNGELFYVIAVVPQNESRNYQRAFNSILQSVQLND